MNNNNDMIERLKQLFPRISISELTPCLASTAFNNILRGEQLAPHANLNPVHNWKVMNALEGKNAIECQGDIIINHTSILDTFYGDSPAGAEAWLKHSGACNSDEFDAIHRKGRKTYAKDEYKTNDGIDLFSDAKYNILKEVCHFGRFFAVRTKEYGWHLLEKINGVSIAPYMQKPNWKNFSFCLDDWLNTNHVPCVIDPTVNMLRYALAGRAPDIAGIDMFLDFLSKVRANEPFPKTKLKYPHRPLTKWLTTSNTKIFNAFIMVTKHSLTEGTSTIFDHFQFDLEAYKSHITETVKDMAGPRIANICKTLDDHWRNYMLIKNAEATARKAKADAQQKGRALNRIHKRQHEAEKALETMERMSKRPRNARNQRDL